MSETPRRELQPPSRNEWYMLATAGEDHTDNTRRWNGYMRHLIGEEKAANLKRGDGTPIELPLLSPDEIEWITSNIPHLPKKLRRMIRLSGLLFEEAVNFQDFYFPVSVDFRESIFKQVTYFEKSIFEEAATFAESIFEEAATFAGSSFEKDASFTESIFEREVDFTESIFEREVDFTESIFEREADFSNSKYEGKTSFQNVTFAVAPLFFATTLHEDTDWTGITWPAKPADQGQELENPAAEAALVPFSPHLLQDRNPPEPTRFWVGRS